MSSFMPQIDHVVVVMMENRSLDHMLGWLYGDGESPRHFLPTDNPAEFDGLKDDMWNPCNLDYFQGAPPVKVKVSRSAASFKAPTSAPKGSFANVGEQIRGPGGADAPEPLKGFVVNFAKTGDKRPGQIMEAYSRAQVPVLSALAKNYAVSDAWFSSVPTHTLANRAFLHAGTSRGLVDNGRPFNPLKWDMPTIFNVLSEIGVSWGIYGDQPARQSLTRVTLKRLWDSNLNANFHSFKTFIDHCELDQLPKYSFIEPCILGINANDQHPPRDIRSGEAFLREIWCAVRSSPAWKKTLLVITYDEHGGCFDHVLPPSDATPPDTMNHEGFDFQTFGIRVPTVVVSPYIEKGTVFRSNLQGSPYDHTSILATLRDWLRIPPDKMLPSQRVAAAPTLAQLLTLSEPRTDLLDVSSVKHVEEPPSPSDDLNDLQQALLTGTIYRFAATYEFTALDEADGLLGSIDLLGRN